MRSPWLDIPLGDYEAHMALPAVGQARMLAHTLEALVTRYAPRSVAVLGCAVEVFKRASAGPHQSTVA